jgi:hypothetical protein
LEKEQDVPKKEKDAVEEWTRGTGVVEIFNRE